MRITRNSIRKCLIAALRDEMIALGRVLCIASYVLTFVIVCKAPVSVEYTQPTSCSSDQFYQISNLSCVNCATNLVKANNGMYLLYNCFVGAYLLELII